MSATPPGMVSIRYLREVGEFRRTKSTPCAGLSLNCGSELGLRVCEIAKNDNRSDSRHIRIINYYGCDYGSGILLCSPEGLSSETRGLVSLISAMCAMAVAMVLL